MLLTTVLFGVGLSSGDAPATRPARQVRVNLTMVEGPAVRGVLVELTDDHVDVGVGKTRRRIPVEDVRPNSLYMLKRQVLDLDDPKVHVRLGRFCLTHGLDRLGEREFAEALRMDGSLTDDVAKARADGKAARARLKAGDPGPVRTEGPKPPPVAEKDVKKYTTPTPRQIERARKRGEEWAKQAKAFAPTLHLAESPHFRIYSAWNVGNDRPLRTTCENMYAALCKQFDIPPTENIWVDKCAVYVFWEKAHFAKFCTDVYKRGNPKAAGFCGWYGGGFVFIAMGPSRSTRQFYELLVHEGTHGFIARYRSNRGIPEWLNEGLAEYMSATLVPKCYSAKQYINATKEAIRKNRPVKRIFDDVELDHFDYGIAQSWVRYLIARDSKAFPKLVDLLKDGKTEAEALKESYNLTRDGFLRAWYAASAEAVGPKR